MPQSDPSRRTRRLPVLSERAPTDEGGLESFRDPAPVDARAEAIEREIARIIARAPTLPIELPVAGLSLRGVRAGRQVLSLLVGRSGTDAAFDVDWPSGQNSARVTLRFERHVSDRDRIEPVLSRLAERLARAITREQWEKAEGLGRELKVLPRGVPLVFFRQRIPGVEPAVGLVRVGFTCNQDCGICWQDRLWGEHGPETILQWIEDLAAAGPRKLVISGGEPALDPRLRDYVAHARALGFEHITIETNAIQLARGTLAFDLAAAGLSSAFVSLHSADAAVSDAITRAPGTFERTCAGIEALLRAKIPVRINAVMTAEGLHALGALPDFLADRFGPHGGVDGLMLSYPTLPYRRDLTASIMTPPEPLRRALRETMARARARGIVVDDVHGPCGAALCAFGEDIGDEPLREVRGVGFRTHPAPCAECAARRYCLGVRPEEIELFGVGCVEPMKTMPASWRVDPGS